MAELNVTMNSLMDKMNYNKRMREVTGKSLLPEIEKDILMIYYKSKDRSREKDISLSTFLVTNPEVMDDKEMYVGLEVVKNLASEVLKSEDMSMVNDVRSR